MGKSTAKKAKRVGKRTPKETKEPKKSKSMKIKDIVPPERVICRVAGIDLTKDSMERLKRGDWICDSIIVAFCTSIKSAEQLIIIPQIATQLFDNHEYGCCPSVQEIFAHQMIAVPYIVNNNHWTVLLINTTSRELVYIDPLGPRADKAAELMAGWQQFIGGDWNLVSIDHAIQEDGANCGIYVCKFIEMFFSWRSNMIFDNSPEMLASYRLIIHDTLYFQ